MVNPNIAIPETFKVTHEQFQQLASVNRDLRLERTATGELIVMPPTKKRNGKPQPRQSLGSYGCGTVRLS